MGNADDFGVDVAGPSQTFDNGPVSGGNYAHQAQNTGLLRWIIITYWITTKVLNIFNKVVT